MARSAEAVTPETSADEGEASPSPGESVVETLLRLVVRRRAAEVRGWSWAQMDNLRRSIVDVVAHESDLLFEIPESCLGVAFDSLEEVAEAFEAAPCRIGVVFRAVRDGLALAEVVHDGAAPAASAE